MQENVITAKILWLMTTEFNYIVCFIEESNMEAMTIDELQSNLQVHEQRMMLAVEEQFMQIVTDEKSLTCFTPLLILNSPLVLTGCSWWPFSTTSHTSWKPSSAFICRLRLS
ncbi:hypothetical protein VIGAN_01032700 [Vigna angularis var. angularis]|uniref:Uncharacterized protein n=1 Tax=Vigna angularis var. angularis TaxID=157739 RepID=A0A0S3QX86_PHAAN|nr:hypothetical protein VIGAN_01032700 [Vigna angularis var. angularis]